MSIYNNAAADNEPEDDEPMHDNGNGGGLRSRISGWFGQLSGRGEDDDYEEDAAPSPAPALRTQATSNSGGATAVASPPPAHRQSHYGTASARRTTPSETLRLANSREGSITVMPVTSFADIQRAADRLKAGEPQIINLEKTPAEVSERLIDFLNGVTYALDGYVEKIAEGAYLFTPSHIAIHADGPEPPASRPFFDRI